MRSVCYGPFSINTHAGVDESNEPFDVLITDGLSDSEVAEGFPRTEFLWYVRRTADAHLQWLLFAGIVHLIDHVYPGSMTMPMCPPCAALADHSLLTLAFFGTSIVKRDQDALTSHGVSVEWLWLLPLTETECAHLKKFGNRGASRAELYRILNARQHPWLLDPTRPSYV